MNFHIRLYYRMAELKITLVFSDLHLELPQCHGNHFACMRNVTSSDKSMSGTTRMLERVVPTMDYYQSSLCFSSHTFLAYRVHIPHPLVFCLRNGHSLESKIMYLWQNLILISFILISKMKLAGLSLLLLGKL